VLPVERDDRSVDLDHDRCYRAVLARDPRFDGRFITAVVTTGIYCRPSCPTPVLPEARNVRFYPSAAAAQAAGFRACKRCRPDATPGSPDWAARTDLAARAVRLIAEGAVDREGVTGVARRLGVSARHLQRVLHAELGAGALALARAQRAQTARILLETTALPVATIAFAAGFSSIRQFNDTVREVFDATPTALRAAARPRTGEGELVLRLAVRLPFDPAVLAFHGRRAVPGVEAWDGETYTRTLRLPRGTGAVAVTWAGDHVRARLRLGAVADLPAAVAATRRLLDLDADPVAVDEVLATDPAFAPLIAARPGVRVPGAIDGEELLVRAILGQQVSVAAATTAAARLAAELGEEVGGDGPGRLFPSGAAIAAVDPASLPMPRARARTLVAAARALADGEVRLDAGADRSASLERLAALEGIGPWTLAYVALRAGDPDAWPGTDLGLRRAAPALGLPDDPRALATAAEAWRPWRSYAAVRLWTTLEGAQP
jgi:AraC family transcriptional regulator of adaptative response / DNA-3-methyladenine glycosylase II